MQLVAKSTGQVLPMPCLFCNSLFNDRTVKLLLTLKEPNHGSCVWTATTSGLNYVIIPQDLIKSCDPHLYLWQDQYTLYTGPAHCGVEVYGMCCCFGGKKVFLYLEKSTERKQSKSKLLSLNVIPLNVIFVQNSSDFPFIVFAKSTPFWNTIKDK